MFHVIICSKHLSLVSSKRNFICSYCNIDKKGKMLTSIGAGPVCNKYSLNSLPTPSPVQNVNVKFTPIARPMKSK